MRIIDEKGRLFGKINIIDFFIVVFLVVSLIFLIPVSYRVFKSSNKSWGVVEKPFTTTCRIPVVFRNLSLDTANLITPGDKEVDNAGRTIGEIVSVGKMESHEYLFNLAYRKDAKNLESKLDAFKKQVPAILELLVDLQGSNLFYKRTPLKQDRYFVFITDEYTLTPYVNWESGYIDTDFVDYAEIKVKFKEILPEIANQIKEGDNEVDNFGSSVATIVSILSRKQAEVVIQESGELTVVNHPITEDIVALMSIAISEKDREPFFKDTKVKLGNKIKFSTSRYDIEGIILSIEKD